MHGIVALNIRGAPDFASFAVAVTVNVNADPGTHAGTVTRTTSVRASPAITSPSKSSPESTRHRTPPPDVSSTCDGAGVPANESTTSWKTTSPAGGTAIGTTFSRAATSSATAMTPLCAIAMASSPLTPARVPMTLIGTPARASSPATSSAPFEGAPRRR